MGKRFYAVKVGRIPGVYASHAHAREQTNGFPRGQMKGFNNHDAALAYISRPRAQQNTTAVGSRSGQAEAEARAEARAKAEAEATRDQAKTAVTAAQSDAQTKEDELTQALADVETKKKALVIAWATVNSRAEALADAEARVEGKDKETFYLHGCAVYTSLEAAQKFSGGRVVYKCHSEKEVWKLVSESGRCFYTMNRGEFNTYENENGETVYKVYVDGSCLNNGASNAIGGVGVHFGEWHPWNVSERLPGSPQTNQRAELAAVKRAYEVIDAKGNGGKYEIHTDSAYAIGCLTEWAPTWQRRGWINSEGSPVQNQDLIRALLLVRDRPSCRHVTLKKCEGHSQDYYNDKADHLAKMGARSDEVGEKKFCSCNYCVRSQYLKTPKYSCPNSKGFVGNVPPPPPRETEAP